MSPIRGSWQTNLRLAPAYLQVRCAIAPILPTMEERFEWVRNGHGMTVAANADPRPLVVTPDGSRRTLSVLRSDEKTDRYALHRYPGGDVSWRADTFSSPRDPMRPERWLAYHGELTLAEVIERVPEHAELLRDWTRSEIERGIYVEGADDFPAQARRGRALERLQAELDTASDPHPRDAAA
jgi:hypothetical protein